MLVLTLLIGTTTHQVKETNYRNIKLFLMGVSAITISKFTLSNRVENAWMAEFVIKLS
jgi:hypothetical protein